MENSIGSFEIQLYLFVNYSLWIKKKKKSLDTPVYKTDFYDIKLDQGK